MLNYQHYRYLERYTYHPQKQSQLFNAQQII